VPCEIEEMTVEIGSVLYENLVVFVCNIRGKNINAHIDKYITELSTK
jgi:hypothetical protein